MREQAGAPAGKEDRGGRETSGGGDQGGGMGGGHYPVSSQFTQVEPSSAE